MKEMSGLDNPNPQVKILRPKRREKGAPQTFEERIFDVIRDIRDPEHPHSLEELSVVELSSVSVTRPADDRPGYGKVGITFTPTVPHCSLASIIGLSIQSKMRESNILHPPGEQYYKLNVRCEDGTHVSSGEINRQLSDKERVSAAFENPRIVSLLRECTDNLP